MTKYSSDLRQEDVDNLLKLAKNGRWERTKRELGLND